MGYHTFNIFVFSEAFIKFILYFKKKKKPYVKKHKK